MKFCFAIPHYNHSKEFELFISELAETGIPCIIVDDGSNSTHRDHIKQLVKTQAWVHYLEHPQNRGKGAAVISACYHARQLGFTHVIQIDADGQHRPADANKLIDAARNHPTAMICGFPIFDSSAPKARLYGRKVTTLMVRIETCSLTIRDALCGFRIYPLDMMEYLVDHYHIGPRMDFDTDIIVKSSWSGYQLVFVDTPVVYYQGATSHFHYLQDNIRLVKLHSFLLAGALIRLPRMLGRALSRSFATASAGKE